MTSTFWHIHVGLTPQNSDPAKMYNNGAPEAQSKAIFQVSPAQGLTFGALRLTLTSPRKARAVYIDKRAKTTE